MNLQAENRRVGLGRKVGAFIDRIYKIESFKSQLEFENQVKALFDIARKYAEVANYHGLFSIAYQELNRNSTKTLILNQEKRWVAMVLHKI